MKKAKKTKAGRKTALDRIAERLRTALQRETKNIIEIGGLLLESRKLLANEHGEWLPWLEKNFDLSARTAQRYIATAEYVASKSDTVSYFSNLAPTVLYALAGGQYNEQEEAAILAATREGRVDWDAASDICDALAPADDDDAGDADDQDDSGEDGGEDSGEDSGEDAVEDAESVAILDGPPPAVPPPAPIPPPTDFALRDFDRAIGELKRLMTKRVAQFADSIHSANDLETVENFLRAVAKAKAVPEVTS